MHQCTIVTQFSVHFHVLYLQERFNISDGIDGSITSYTINISFSDSEFRCSLPADVPLSSCMDGMVCKITVSDLTSLPCYNHPSQAVVMVFASNLLRDGLPSMTSLSTLSSYNITTVTPFLHAHV